ncbi:hypothetical protein HanIR_Chr11g0546301 [Helianthus annuus]|nr:hypothetical protein HanIR_Chr11g0546301 [Helianthus annuus]
MGCAFEVYMKSPEVVMWIWVCIKDPVLAGLLCTRQLFISIIVSSRIQSLRTLTHHQTIRVSFLT